MKWYALRVNPSNQVLYFEGTAFIRYSKEEKMEQRKFGPKEDGNYSLGQLCPGCKEQFKVGDMTTLVVIGPGDDPQARETARAGGEYNAVAIEAHWSCVTGEESS